MRASAGELCELWSTAQHEVWDAERELIQAGPEASREPTARDMLEAEINRRKAACEAVWRSAMQALAAGPEENRRDA